MRAVVIGALIVLPSALTAVEVEATEWTPRQWAERAGTGVSTDESLHRAAARHARAVGANVTHATLARVRRAIQAEGLADAQIQPFTAIGSEGATAKELRDFIQSRVKGRGVTHMGVARRGEVMVAIFVRRLLELPPLPDRVDDEARHVIRGLQRRAKILEAFLTGPTGEVKRLKVARNGRSFALGVPFSDGRGLYRFEMLMHDERGPEVVALWTFRKGVPAAMAKTPKPLTKRGLADAIQKVRAAYDCPALRPNGALKLAAERHAKTVCHEMIAAHEWQGQSPSDRARTAGYPHRATENIAIAEHLGEAHQNLLDSPSHRANLLSREIREFGLGIVEKRGTVCLVELFGAGQPGR